MDTTTLHNVMAQATATCWLGLRAQYGKRVGKMPELYFNNRLRTTAGRAHINGNIVELATKLVPEFPQEYIKVIIPHELAHIVAYRVFGEENHGLPWKQIMANMGLSTSPYHNLFQIRNARQQRAVARKIKFLSAFVTEKENDE